MKRLVLTVVVAVALAGCVERQMTIASDPPGAKLYYNNRYVGETPVTFHFTYYQAPDLRLEKDGYETLRVVQKVKPPVYERLPFDLFAEAAPLTLYDRVSFSYMLTRQVDAEPQALVDRANDLARETLGTQE
jgi:hypothetical protein